MSVEATRSSEAQIGSIEALLIRAKRALENIHAALRGSLVFEKPVMRYMGIGTNEFDLASSQTLTTLKPTLTHFIQLPATVQLERSVGKPESAKLNWVRQLLSFARARLSRNDFDQTGRYSSLSKSVPTTSDKLLQTTATPEALAVPLAHDQHLGSQLVRSLQSSRATFESIERALGEFSGTTNRSNPAGRRAERQETDEDDGSWRRGSNRGAKLEMLTAAARSSSASGLAKLIGARVDGGREDQSTTAAQSHKSELALRNARSLFSQSLVPPLRDPTLALTPIWSSSPPALKLLRQDTAKRANYHNVLAAINGVTTLHGETPKSASPTSLSPSSRHGIDATDENESTKSGLAESQIINYSPTVVVKGGDSVSRLEERIMSVISSHAYELSDLIRREMAKRQRSRF